MRILVTGSRDWTDPEEVYEALSEYAISVNSLLTVVHGSCPTGADHMAHHWCGAWYLATGHNPEESHPADWDKYGKSAGFRRNAEMVNLGADVCLAFINPCTKQNCPEPKPHDSHGAAMTADLAEKAGIPVRYFRQ